MDSIIQSFAVTRKNWDNAAVIDFTQAKCCVLTGTNGGGKTLTLKMLKAVGQWVENPTRYNFHEMKNIALSTEISSAKITIRAQIMKGHDSNVESIHWANKWNFEVNESLQESVNTDSLQNPNTDFAVDVAKLITTEVFFGNELTVTRQESLEIHYMIRDKIYRSDRDIMLFNLFEQNRERNNHNEDLEEVYLPFDSLKLDTLYGPEVHEYSTVIAGEKDEKSTHRTRNLRILEPHPNDVIGEYSILQLLKENGIGIDELDREFTFKAQEVSIRVPIMLRVDRNLPNISADLDNIRNLNDRLENSQEVLNMLVEGRKNYMDENNCFSAISEVVLVRQNQINPNQAIEIDTLDGIDHQYLAHSQPFFPSWLAFKRFVGHIPANQYLSSGQLQLLAMTKAVLATRPNSLIMIDEPELSLHIDWQRELIHFFKTTFPKHNFVFSTHSPDILYNDLDQVIQIPPEE